MSNYEKILAEFESLGYNQKSFLQQNEINKALNSIASENAGVTEFDPLIAEELWNHCVIDPNGGVRIDDFINCVVEAENILRDQIEITEIALKTENRPKEREELQEEYNQIITDHQIISAPFNLSPLRQASLLDSETPESKASNYFTHRGESAIFSNEPNIREESSEDLKVVLLLTAFSFVTELILMFHKHHFLNLLVLFGVFSIYFLNYFDKNYMKFLLVFILFSIITDIVWLGVNAREYWNPEIETQHSTLNETFLAFVFIMVIVIMAMKIIIAGILFKYRSITESFKKSINAFENKLRIRLDGRPNNNPFTPLLRSLPKIY